MGEGEGETEPLQGACGGTKTEEPGLLWAKLLPSMCSPWGCGSGEPTWPRVGLRWLCPSLAGAGFWMVFSLAEGPYHAEILFTVFPPAPGASLLHRLALTVRGKQRQGAPRGGPTRAFGLVCMIIAFVGMLIIFQRRCI